MSDKIAQLKSNLRTIIGADPGRPIAGMVTKVAGDTCTVMLQEGFEVSDVRLKATADGSDNFLIIPKIGTSVMMLSGDGTMDTLAVIKCDVAEKIFYNENGLLVEIDSKTGKVKLENNQTSVRTLFQQLTDLLRGLKVFTPAGPSGTLLPDSVMKLNQFENDFKSILK